MLTQITNGNILTPKGWVKGGSVIINDSKIQAVTDNELAIIGANVVDAKGMNIVPGFVAMQVYGGGGHDFRECTEEAFRTVISTHLKYGATSIFPTLTTSPTESIYKAISICEKIMAEKNTQVMGLHLAGPYLNPKMTNPIHKIRGINKEEYEKHYLLPFAALEAKLREYAQQEYAYRTYDGRWRLTPKGFLVSNTIISDLLLLQEQTQ